MRLIALVISLSWITSSAELPHSSVCTSGLKYQGTFSNYTGRQYQDVSFSFGSGCSLTLRSIIVRLRGTYKLLVVLGTMEAFSLHNQTTILDRDVSCDSNNLCRNGIRANFTPGYFNVDGKVLVIRLSGTASGQRCNCTFVQAGPKSPHLGVTVYTEDIDECGLATHACGPETKCKIVLGTYECVPGETQRITSGTSSPLASRTTVPPINITTLSSITESEAQPKSTGRVGLVVAVTLCVVLILGLIALLFKCILCKRIRSTMAWQHVWTSIRPIRPRPDVQINNPVYDARIDITDHGIDKRAAASRSLLDTASGMENQGVSPLGPGKGFETPTRNQAGCEHTYGNIKEDEHQQKSTSACVATLPRYENKDYLNSPRLHTGADYSSVEVSNVQCNEQNEYEYPSRASETGNCAYATTVLMLNGQQEEHRKAKEFSQSTALSPSNSNYLSPISREV